MNEQRATVKAEVIAILEEVRSGYEKGEGVGMDYGTELKRIGAQLALTTALARIRTEVTTEGAG